QLSKNFGMATTMRFLHLAACCLLVARAADLVTKEDEHGVRQPTLCEVCKYSVIELEKRLAETESHSVVMTKAAVPYKDSELRLIEVLENPPLCDRLLAYQLHKEHKNSLRFKPGKSVTFKTLDSLVAKGVKVDLGIPKELWDSAPTEVHSLKKECEALIETWEDDIRDWFFTGRSAGVRLADFLCRQRVLRGREEACLGEKYPDEKDEL
ncbi:hypothetical protein BOX15_Mlig029149g1, partial [Macrostomum lignano]